MIEAIHDWWLGTSSGPDTLLVVRVAVLAFMAMALFFAVWNVIRPAEWERTWDADQYKRVRIMNLWRAAALLGECAYLVMAGVFEQDRTSSPNRLLFANAALFLLISWQVADLIFWRVHFYRKSEKLAERGITRARDKGAA